MGGRSYQACQPVQAYREIAKWGWAVSLGASPRMSWGWQPVQQDPTLLLSNNLSLPWGSRSHCAASSPSAYQLLDTVARGIPKATILDQKPPDPHQPLARAVQALTHAGSPQGTLIVGWIGVLQCKCSGNYFFVWISLLPPQRGTDLCLGALCAVTVSIFNHGN